MVRIPLSVCKFDKSPGNTPRLLKATNAPSSSGTSRESIDTDHCKTDIDSIELYFADKRNFLIVLKDKKERQGIVQKLMSKNDHRDAISRSIIGNFVLDTVAKAVDKSAEQLDNMTKRWQMREISTVRSQFREGCLTLCSLHTCRS